MATCTSCGSDVTGKKFCQQCGAPVQPVSAPAISGQSAPASNLCPRCNGEVKPGAAFCMHCGSSLSARAVVPTTLSQPLTHICPACHAEVVANNAFCSNCGQNMQAQPAQPVSAAPASSFCTNCGRQTAPGVRFCAGCGSPIAAGTAMPGAQTSYTQPGQYPQQPQQYNPSQYGQPQYAQPQYGQQQYPQQYPQQAQMSYQPQPMIGQQPMVLRCPVCMAMAPMGTPSCPSCHTSLAGIVPTPANVPQAQGQQGMLGGLGNFMQGNGGKYAVGALGGAAAVLGGEMLMHGVENRIEDRVEGDMGYGYERHHYHREEEGMFGGMGDIANDIGLF